MVFKSLKYMALVYINIRKKTQLISGLTKGRQLYAKYYFLVNFINIENEFETLRDNFPRVDFNITGADKHVPEAEWQIRVFKKRTWSVQHTLPFRKIWTKIIIMMFNFSVLWLNNPPVSSGVGGDLSPTTIVTGRTIDFKLHYNI